MQYRLTWRGLFAIAVGQLGGVGLAAQFTPDPQAWVLAVILGQTLGLAVAVLAGWFPPRVSPPRPGARPR